MRQGSRLRRRLFDLATAVSLLLLVIIIVAWVRSRTGESFQWYYYTGRVHEGRDSQLDERHHIAALNNGYLCLSSGWSDLPARDPRGRAARTMRSRGRPPRVQGSPS